MKFLTVARHEFISTLKRRSALFVLFGLPLLSVLMLVGVNWLGSTQMPGSDTGSNGGAGRSILNELVFEAENAKPIGLVDLSGRIETLPPPADSQFRQFLDEASARDAFAAGEIRSFYLIPANYLQQGELFYYADTFSINVATTTLYRILLYNVASPDLPRERIVQPWSTFKEVDVSTGESQTEMTFFGNLMLGVGVGILFYLTVMGASGYLLQGLGAEKQNRVMEILLSSVRPFELLLGKMVGLGGIGLLQMAIWSGLALLLFNRSDFLLADLPLPSLTLGQWLLILLYFVFGYLVYASLFAGLGAIMPGPRESSQFTFLVMLPTFIPLWFSGVLLSAPNGALATSLSLIPLTAPLAMPLRLVSTAVPVWQWLLSLGLSLITAVFALWLATQFFRSRFLLTTQGISLQQLWRDIRA